MNPKIKEGRGRALAFAILSTALAIGAFVPLLVNFAIAGRFDWSLIPLGAVVMTWLILAPWFVFHRHRVIISWAAAALSVPLFLWLVESLGQDKGWWLSLGLPAAALGLAGMGCIIWIWRYSRTRVWYALSLTFFVLAFLSLTESLLARPFIQPDPIEWVRYLVTSCLGGVSVMFALVAFLVHK